MLLSTLCPRGEGEAMGEGGDFDQKQTFGVKLPNPWDKISIQSSPPWEKILSSKLKNMCWHLTRLFHGSCCSSERQWEGSE